MQKDCFSADTRIRFTSGYFFIAISNTCQKLQRSNALKDIDPISSYFFNTVCNS